MECVSLFGSICGIFKKCVFLIVLPLMVRPCNMSPTYVGMLNKIYYLNFVWSTIPLRFRGCGFPIMSKGPCLAEGVVILWFLHSSIFSSSIFP